MKCQNLFYIFFQKTQVLTFHVVSNGDNLHEMSKLFSEKKKKKNM